MEFFSKHRFTIGSLKYTNLMNAFCKSLGCPLILNNKEELTKDLGKPKSIKTFSGEKSSQLLV